MGATNSQLEHSHPNFAILKSTNKSPSSSLFVFFVCLVFRVWSSRVSRVQQPEVLSAHEGCATSKAKERRRSRRAVEARLTTPAAAARSWSSATACQTTREKTPKKRLSSTLQQTQGVSNYWAALGSTLVHTLKQRSFLNYNLFNSLTRTNLHYKHWHLSIHFPSAQTCVCVCVCMESFFFTKLLSWIPISPPGYVQQCLVYLSHMSHMCMSTISCPKKFKKAYQQQRSWWLEWGCKQLASSCCNRLRRIFFLAIGKGYFK
jgi:hypothetical protein